MREEIRLKKENSFITKAKLNHGSFYDYSMVDYRGARTTITIGCPRHGWFQQRPTNHLCGSGCNECKKEKLRLIKSMSVVDFINKAKKTHGKKYDYSDTIYQGIHSQIEYRCKKHGVVTQIATDHLNGAGCKECYFEKRRLSPNEFISRSQCIHTKYDYSKVVYSNVNTKVEIICPEHGSFWQKPNDHLQGHGCSECSVSGFKYDSTAILYYIKDTKMNLYKIGITNKTVHERFHTALMKRVRVIQTWVFKKGENAFRLEQFLHKIFKCHRINNKQWGTDKSPNGKTEFFSKDVLRLDR